MSKSEKSFHAMLQSFFLQRLITQRKVSDKTVSSYRDSFKIYFAFLLAKHQVQSRNIEMKHFEANFLTGFCEYLAKERSNKPATVNNRLSAVHSFLQYVCETNPEYSGSIRKALMDFITKPEFDAMLSSCDLGTPIGRRDKLMLLLLYNTGMRVSELLGIQISDLFGMDRPGEAVLKVYGKGRKERAVPLWKSTAKYLCKYIQHEKLSTPDRLFINKNGSPLTRSGVRSRIESIVKLSANTAPSLSGKNIFPHSFRHSVAMNLLSSGVDISTIAIWLGHSSIETTHKYMVADIELKRKAMEKVGRMGNAAMKYHPSPDILGFLNSL